MIRLSNCLYMHLALVNDTRSILPDIYPDLNINQVISNAAVNGKLELTLLKGRQRFYTVSTSNLKV